MRFVLEYPVETLCDDGAWIDPENMAEFARIAEASGVDAIALTDHPAPSKTWLESGGHETLDPFVGLGYLAAFTSRVRLMTWLTVVPYRNPLLLAKAMTAVDVVSGGRATYVLGTGYLRSEFAALGVDFDERNLLFDEAVEVLHGVWSTDDFHYRGRHFDARGVALMPQPVQRPHPPLWLGGNAQVVRRRVAAWGQGWAPLVGGQYSTRTTRTRSIESDEDLAAKIREIGDGMDANGRDRSELEVFSASATPLSADAGVQEQLDAIRRLGEIGVTWTQFPCPRGSFAEALDAIQAYGEAIVAAS